MRYEKRLRKGGSYIYDLLEKRVLNNTEVCELLNKLNKRIKEKEISLNRNKDNCKFYDKNNCSIPCSWYKCNMVEIGRKSFIFLNNKLNKKL